MQNKFTIIAVVIVSCIILAKDLPAYPQKYIDEDNNEDNK